MDCRCLDCGAAFKSDAHTDQCARCRTTEDAMYANVPPVHPNEFRRAPRRPPKPGEGGIEPSGKPLPPLTDWRTTSPGPLMVCRCGVTGTQFFGTGILSRQTCCEECQRQEEAEYLRRLADRPTQGAA